MVHLLFLLMCFFAIFILLTAVGDFWDMCSYIFFDFFFFFFIAIFSSIFCNCFFFYQFFFFAFFFFFFRLFLAAAELSFELNFMLIVTAVVQSVRRSTPLPHIFYIILIFFVFCQFLFKFMPFFCLLYVLSYLFFHSYRALYTFFLDEYFYYLYFLFCSFILSHVTFLF